jgi:hypothetical protein
VHKLHDDLTAVAFVLCFAGILTHLCIALNRGDLRSVLPNLTRLGLIPIIIVGLETWGDTLVDIVTGLNDDIGASSGSTIFQDYQAAIARKLGTAAASANLNQTNQPNMPLGEGEGSQGFQPTNGAILTHYAYQGDSTPDTNSAQGIGAFPFSSAAGSLIPMYSAALTDAAAAQYHVQPGQSFTVGTSTGSTYNLVYADRAPQSDVRVDIYDPNNALGAGNNFSQGLTSLNGGPIVQGATGLQSMLPNPGGSIGDQVMWAIALSLSWVASAIMYLMTIAQKILYLIEIAISPVFIAFLMIPALAHLARRFFMILVGICLWPFGWAVANMVTRILIDLAVNPTMNQGLATANVAASLTGPLAGFAYLIIIAVWVIGSTLAAPAMIAILFAIGGGSATAAMFGSTLGAAALMSASTGSQMMGGAAGAASMVAGIGSGSAPSMSRMTAPRFSRRPKPLTEDA